MGRLNEVEKYFIRGNKDAMTAKQISEKMRKAVTEKDVSTYVEEVETQLPNAGDAMGRQMGVVVMTETASQMGDEHAEGVRSSEKGLDTSVIHKIKE